MKGICNSQIIIIVSDQNTDPMNGKRPFEERVFARFDAVDSAIRGLDSRLEVLEVRADDTNLRLEKLEIRAYDTKPIWEQALKEIMETKRETLETRRELSKRLDRMDAIVKENRADMRDAEHRLDKVESKLNK